MRSASVIAASLLIVSAIVAADAQAGTLEKVRTSGTFSIGYRDASPPFSSKDAAEPQPTGYSIELCNRIAAAVKTRLALSKLELRYVRVTPEDRIEKLLTGEIDIECGSTTRTLGRQEQVDFTLLTFVTGTELLVRVGSNIDDFAALEGKTVGILPGTTAEQVVQSALKTRVVNAKVALVKDHDDGVAAVEDGRVDAYASDQVLLIGLAKKAKDPAKLRLSGKLYSYEPYALMIRPDDSEFRYVADRTLAEMFRSGEIAETYRRWFGDWNAAPSALLLALFVLQSLPD